MSSESSDFHRGLAAQAWVSIEGGPEIAYFHDVIEASGTPVLDAGCGAGRLLLPYLREGLDVEGCDVSPDMLAICRDKGESQGLRPVLHEQPLHAIDLPRRYRTIIVCGAFGLGTDQDQDAEGLRRIYQHLLPGGTLAIDFEAPWTDADTWTRWPPEQRRELPVSWGSEELAPDGSLVKRNSTLEAVDPLDRSVMWRVRYEVWREGRLEHEEAHSMRERWHFPSELRLMLQVAGFRDIELEGAYEHRAPTPDDAFLVFIARK